MTNEAVIEKVLELGADYIGFILYSKSPRGISLSQAIRLSEPMPLNKAVIVNVEPGVDAIARSIDAGFKNFQIHFDLETDRSMIEAWSEKIGEENLWLAPRLAPGEAFPESLFQYTNTILLDTFSKQQVGGTGQTGDWECFKKIKTQYPEKKFILAGGLNPQNVVEAIERTSTEHIDVNSGVESQPGIKDPKKVKALFQALHSRDA